MTRCLSGWIVLPLLLIATSVCQAWDASEPTARLSLKNEDVYEGQLLDCDQANFIRWQSPIAETPLEFPVTAIRGLHRDRDGDKSAGMDATCLELAGGDVLFGKLKSLTSEAAHMETALLGDVEVPRSQIARVFLAEEQSQEIDRLREERWKYQYNAAVKVHIATVQRLIAMTQEQREELAKLLPMPSKSGKVQEGMFQILVCYQLSTIPQEKLLEILDEAQVEAINNFRQQYAAYKEVLRSQGFEVD